MRVAALPRGHKARLEGAWEIPTVAPRLTERQQSAVLSATDPLEVYQRDAFMTALTLLLKNRNEVSDGELFRM